MTTNLKECPNLECGSHKESHRDDLITTYPNPDDPGFHGVCRWCFTRGPKGKTRAEALAKWNTAFLRESDNPWVAIGSGDDPTKYVRDLWLHFPSFHRPVWGNWCNGKFWDEKGVDASDATHYKLKPDPGRPEDE